MAKKRSSNGINMSLELRNIIGEDRSATFSEAYRRLQEKFPGESINRNSASVAFYKARQTMGVSGKKRPAKKRAAGGKKTVKVMRPAARSLDMETLKAAAKFVSEIGNADKAVAAIKQVQSLQIG